MMKALIVDDEKLARQRLRRMLKNESDIEIIGECANGAETVDFIKRNQTDIVFLDINMPEMNGLEVLQTIYSPQMPVVIFVTAFDHYAIEAFELHALDYLLKPVKPERLKAALNHVRQILAKKKVNNFNEEALSLLSEMKEDKLKAERRFSDRIMVRSPGRIYFLPTGDITWIEAAGNYVNLHTGQQRHLLRETMRKLETRLDPAKFVRVHRSTIVNIDSVAEMRQLFTGDYLLILHDKTELILSRHYRERFIKMFEN